MTVKILLSTGEELTFKDMESYGKFLVFHAAKYEYRVLGEVPRLPYSPLLKKYAVMAAQIRANRERNKKE